MDTGQILEIALKLLSKKSDVVNIINDAVDLWKRVQTVFPKLTGGDTGSTPKYDVKWLQESLNKLGAKLTVDGRYGEATREAVKKFQAEHDLEADGWAGALTTAAIIDALKSAP